MLYSKAVPANAVNLFTSFVLLRIKIPCQVAHGTQQSSPSQCWLSSQLLWTSCSLPYWECATNWFSVTLNYFGVLVTLPGSHLNLQSDPGPCCCSARHSNKSNHLKRHVKAVQGKTNLSSSVHAKSTIMASHWTNASTMPPTVHSAIL